MTQTMFAPTICAPLRRRAAPPRQVPAGAMFVAMAGLGAVAWIAIATAVLS